MKVEFYPDMTNEDYHARREHLSKSMLGEAADCWARYKYLYLDGGAPPVTKSLRLGSAMHTLALEPEKWKTGYYIMPQKPDGGEIVRNEKHAAYKEQLQEAAGRLILTTKEKNQVEGMANSLIRDRYAFSLLNAAGYVESSIFWQEDDLIDEQTGEITPGLKFRCKPDKMRNDRLIIDLKSANSVREDNFMRDAWNFHYDLSVALTSRGYESMYGVPPDEYVMLAVEPEPPHLLGYWDSSQPMMDWSPLSYLDMGQSRLNNLLHQYRECLKTNVWPGYNKKIGHMRVPGYMMKKMQRGDYD